MHPHYEDTLRQVTAWARSEPTIHAVIVIGSQARETLPADQWSDLDLLVLADEPRTLLDDAGWIEQFGAPACTFAEFVPVEFTGWQWFVRRVLYSDLREVDFSLLPHGLLAQVLAANRALLAKGWRIAYDDSGQLDEQVRAALAAGSTEAPPAPPTPEQLQAVVSELLYHVIWAQKKLRRGELWAATGCINGHMRGLLLWLLEAHTALLAGQPDRMGYNGRFIDRRMTPEARALLAGAFTRYDAGEAQAALGQLFTITHRLAGELCAQAGWPLDEAQFERVKELFFNLCE